MSYTERIYIQNANSCVRNKDLLNIRTSGEWCEFTSPSFTISGATKIQGLTIGDEGLYLPGEITEIPITFNLTGGTEYSASTVEATFEIYDYDWSISAFTTPYLYTETFSLSGLSGTSAYTANIPITSIPPDNEYLIKTYFEFGVCTEFSEMLELRENSRNISGTEYGLYNPDEDYYMSISYSALTPQFSSTYIGADAGNSLIAYTKFPTVKGQTDFVLLDYLGSVIVCLNGITLAPNYDYSINGLDLNISAGTLTTDVLTIIHMRGNEVLNGLTHHYIDVATITSGATDGQGTNDVYYNTTEGKYEIYTPTNMSEYNDIIVTLNGVVLAYNIDYYKSISNDKRIILEGTIMTGDIINIYYFSDVTYVGDIYTNSPTVTWYIEHPPQLVNGEFTLEMSTGSTFTDMVFSSITDYVVGQTFYNDTLQISGSVGTEYYYRVKNEKNYQPITGSTIDTIAYSEIIPIVLQTNNINSY